MLYSTPPDYDVFKSRPERTTDETETADEPGERAETPDGIDESPGPVMARANWTGTVSADD